MKNLIFLGMLLCGIQGLQAQEFFRIGAKGGINFANLVGQDVDELKMRTGFHLGLVSEIPLSGNFYFGPEVLYSSQGAKFDERGSDGFFKIDYIQIPLMGRYYILEGFNIEAGPQIGFLTSSKVESEGESIDLKDSLKGFEYGVNLGLGYRINGGIFLQGRYNLGLANIFDSEDFDGGEGKNSVIQISIGFIF